MLLKSRITHESQKPLKWICIIVGALFAIVIGLYIVPRFDNLFQYYTFELKEREPDQNNQGPEIDETIKNVFGQYQTFTSEDNILTDELLLKSYDYSHGESRLFSKYFAKKDPDNYDVSIVDAIGAATSYSSYFKPKTITKNGETSLYLDLQIFE